MLTDDDCPVIVVPVKSIWMSLLLQDVSRLIMAKTPDAGLVLGRLV